MPRRSPGRALKPAMTKIGGRLTGLARTRLPGAVRRGPTCLGQFGGMPGKAVAAICHGSNRGSAIGIQPDRAGRTGCTDSVWE